MNTEQATEMIDAIFDGGNYQNKYFRVNSNEFCLRVGPAEAVIDNPRSAREIAAALVTWANRIDGNLFDPLQGLASLKSLRLEAWREDWYRRSVSCMTPATRERNLKNLKKLHAESVEARGSNPVTVDMEKAIHILQFVIDGGDPDSIPDFRDNEE